MNLEANLKELQYILKLKEINRGGRVLERPESSAEHVWSTMIIAKYFLTNFEELKDINQNEVMNIILFHELVEIESGDTFILDKKLKETQVIREQEAIETVSGKLSDYFKEEYVKYAHEFENQDSIESKFAKAMDQLEPLIHWLDYKEDWKKAGFTLEIINNKKRKYMEPFPPVLNVFETLVKYLVENNYLDYN